MRPFVDVVVCVHNAQDYVQKCLQSLWIDSGAHFRTIIVDDGSDEITKVYLEEMSEQNGFKLIRNEAARGYTAAANQGIKAAEGDYIILLNSDTIVTGHWLEKLVECASACADTGIVGPLSNEASWQSLQVEISDEEWGINSSEKGLSLEMTGAIVEGCSDKGFPEVFFVNGFCYMIKRLVIDSIGLLDEVNFPAGYGEEDDYSLRAIKAGFRLRIADHCFIYHAKTKSFSQAARRRLTDLGFTALQGKHGAKFVNQQIDRMINNGCLNMVKEKITRRLAEGNAQWPDRAIKL